MIQQTSLDPLDTRGGGEGVGGNGEVDVDGEDRFPGRRSRIVRGQKQVNMPSVLREVWRHTHTPVYKI